MNEGREEWRKEGRKEGRKKGRTKGMKEGRRKEGRKEGRNGERKEGKREEVGSHLWHLSVHSRLAERNQLRCRKRTCTHVYVNCRGLDPS